MLIRFGVYASHKSSPDLICIFHKYFSVQKLANVLIFAMLPYKKYFHYVLNHLRKFKVFKNHGDTYYKLIELS